MPSTVAIQLTQLESLFLSDSISMFMQGVPDALPGQTMPFPDLLLKIGGAVLETEQRKDTANVHVSLADLWVIREVTKSSAVIGSERVGLNLLFKVYTGIQSLSAENDMESVVSVLGEVMEDEPGKSEYAVQLERIRNGGDLYSGGNDDGRNAKQGDSDKQSLNADENRPDHDAATAA
ncbi:MAG: hypothetical protein BZY79_04610 [SAR202 cluster bacterium Casp-Chloro-G4]|nr:hypothetical protein [Chloroflexota bacterium]MDA1228761.1 hypothetical protein [Chloroflexota bacterium]PKB61261.1 MAG: hypothetical protein BZY79_04610 [SAR202 cluster bacterium Casp-Chloro-G4]